MAATYVNVTVEDVEAFLGPQGFKAIPVERTRELVYAKRVDQPRDDGRTPNQLSLRVYTGIDPDGNSRDVGADAMRCVLFTRNDEGVVRKVATSKRVHRVAGWRANLQERLDAIAPGPDCPSCGAPTVLRTSARGEFYGCSNFPTCRGTRPKR